MSSWGLARRSIIRLVITIPRIMFPIYIMRTYRQASSVVYHHCSKTVLMKSWHCVLTGKLTAWRQMPRLKMNNGRLHFTLLVEMLHIFRQQLLSHIIRDFFQGMDLLHFRRSDFWWIGRRQRQSWRSRIWNKLVRVLFRLRFAVVSLIKGIGCINRFTLMLPRCYAPHIHNGGKAISFYCYDTQLFQLFQEADNCLSVAVPFLWKLKGRYTSLSLH